MKKNSTYSYRSASERLKQIIWILGVVIRVLRFLAFAFFYLGRD